MARKSINEMDEQISTECPRDVLFKIALHLDQHSANF